jgi:hypothetical protein
MSHPNAILAQGTNWRFVDELKRETRTSMCCRRFAGVEGRTS